MDAWAWYWLAWFVVALAAFAIPEAIAISRDNKQTLSHHVWELLKTYWRVPFTIAFFGTVIWLSVHFFVRTLGW